VAIKRAAIIGTAETWRECPFDDPSLYITSLNDAYQLGLPRVDEWWELHPFNEMHFYDPKVPVRKSDLPASKYVRPVGHLEWLKAQAATIPVWLQREPEGWPVNAKRFPIEHFEERFGTYWASGPAYMLMSLFERGYREIHIYGIHLATDREREQQRHNFECLIGRVLGPCVSERVDGDVRVIDGTFCRIVLPVASPLLKSGWRYAYDPKPAPVVNPYHVELKATRKAKDALVRSLVHWPVGVDKTDALERLSRLEIVEIDCQQQLAKRQSGGTLVIPQLAA
jgi:hypothetical protein